MSEESLNLQKKYICIALFSITTQSSFSGHILPSSREAESSKFLPKNIGTYLSDYTVS